MGCSSDDSSDATTTSVAVTTTQETTTSAEPTTASTTTTLAATTTTTNAQDLIVEFPFEGFWTTECELGGSGIVQPHAVVSVGDVEFNDDGPDRANPGWWYWFENTAAVAVDPGVNLLEFVATYDDGSTLVETVTVTCDPQADLEYGFVVSMDMYDGDEGYLMTFIRGDLDEQPDGGGVDSTGEVVVIPVHPDALFTVEDAQREFQKQLTVEEFAALVTFVDEGLCLDCPDGDCPQLGNALPLGPGCIWLSWEEEGIEAIPFEMLVDTEGRIRQGTQLVYN